MAKVRITEGSLRIEVFDDNDQMVAVLACPGFARLGALKIVDRTQDAIVVEQVRPEVAPRSGGRVGSRS